MAGWTYNIDIVGACNLACPTCPQTTGGLGQRGRMTIEVFEAICSKAARETPDIACFALYNKAEPTLHPELPLFLRMARRYGLKPSLSTNANHPADWESILLEEPESIRVSVSGFTQSVYGRTHVDGEIRKVKQQMRALAFNKTLTGASTYLDVTYHCYRHNLGSEYRLMRRFAKNLGYGWAPVYAYLMDIPGLVEHYENYESTLPPVTDLLLVHPDLYPGLPRKHSDYCDLRSNRVAINPDGSATLCCAVSLVVGDFLSTDLSKLQTTRHAHPFCDKCMAHNLNQLGLYRAGYRWNRAARQSSHHLPLALTLHHLLT